MRCDRCGRNIDDGPMVTMGAKRPYRNLCRTCWSVETRSSNSRLISALNEMTRRMERKASAREEPWDGSTERRAAHQRGHAGAERRGRGRAAGAPAGQVDDPRQDPERQRWHL